MEYGLFIAGIALAVMTAIYSIATSLSGKFTSVRTQLASSSWQSREPRIE